MYRYTPYDHRTAGKFIPFPPNAFTQATISANDDGTLTIHYPFDYRLGITVALRASMEQFLASAHADNPLTWAENGFILASHGENVVR